jgi:hypothetical protein
VGRREIQNAFADGARPKLIPFRIQVVTYSKALRYYIASVQWIDASAGQLEPHLRTLIENVGDHLTASRPRPTTSIPAGNEAQAVQVTAEEPAKESVRYAPRREPGLLNEPVAVLPRGEFLFVGGYTAYASDYMTLADRVYDTFNLAYDDLVEEGGLAGVETPRPIRGRRYCYRNDRPSAHHLMK